MSGARFAAPWQPDRGGLARMPCLEGAATRIGRPGPRTTPFGSEVAAGTSRKVRVETSATMRRIVRVGGAVVVPQPSCKRSSWGSGDGHPRPLDSARRLVSRETGAGDPGRRQRRAGWPTPRGRRAALRAPGDWRPVDRRRRTGGRVAEAGWEGARPPPHSRHGHRGHVEPGNPSRRGGTHRLARPAAPTFPDRAGVRCPAVRPNDRGP